MTECEETPQKIDIAGHLVILHKKAQYLDASDLDTAVDDVMSKRASEINNRGKNAQLAFLLKELGLSDAI